jgi:integrase
LCARGQEGDGNDAQQGGGPFATQNAETLSADALQALMRHRSYSTTQRYINVARQINRSVEKLHVPDVLKVKAG